MSQRSSAIDWASLLTRQQAAFDAVLQNRHDHEREQLLLQERARVMSQKPAEDAGSVACVDCLEFTLSGEHYAIDLSFIAATLPLADFTPLFCTPPFVLGITSVRGKIISIVDLRRFFELPAAGLSDLNRVIVVSDGTMEFGVLADHVEGMRSLSLTELHPTPDTFTGMRGEFLAGVTTERLALLDMARILADPRLVVHEEVG